MLLKNNGEKFGFNAPLHRKQSAKMTRTLKGGNITTWNNMVSQIILYRTELRKMKRTSYDVSDGETRRSNCPGSSLYYWPFLHSVSSSSSSSSSVRRLVLGSVPVRKTLFFGAGTKRPFSSRTYLRMSHSAR